MTREILFRGFHEDLDGSTTIYVDGREVKGEWVHGYYWLNAIQRTYITNADGDMYFVISSTVGQYTGKSDLENNKVFTGCVCCDRDYEDCFTIIWNERYLAFMACYSPGDEEHLADIWNEDCCITGTIFDKEDSDHE